MNSDFDDVQVTNATLPLLRAAALNRTRDGRPWLVAAGYRKPHLVWKFPARFLNASYAPASSCASEEECLASVPLPKHPRFPPSAPLLGFHQPNDDFNLAFDDVVQCGGAQMSPFWNFSATCQRQFRRAYFAAISSMDHEVGRLLAEIQQLGAADETIVVFFGDHGWQVMFILPIYARACALYVT